MSSTELVRRVVSVAWQSADKRYSIVLIAGVEYLVRRVSNILFTVTELSDKRQSSYELWLGKRDECGCGHAECVHAAAIRALSAAGKI